MVTMKQIQSKNRVKAKEYFPKSYDFTIHETQEVDNGDNETVATQ